MKLKEKLYSLKVEEKPGVGSAENEEKAPCLHQPEDQESGTVKLAKDPFELPMRQCIFCQHNIPLDYKNVQLLSQFVSPHTGIIYSQQVTGLCHFKYLELEKVIFKAKKLGLMPFFYKETTFVDDPQLFNPFANNLSKIPNDYDRRKLNSDD
jgi:small subunit ribosomal protein S18